MKFDPYLIAISIIIGAGGIIWFTAIIYAIKKSGKKAVEKRQK